MFKTAVVPLVLPFLIAFNVWADDNPQAPAAPARLNLVVVGGNDAINNIKQRTSRDTIVEVQDENHRPVAGAAVAFLLPDSGPGGTFPGGAKSVSLVTNSQGRVVMPRLTANNLSGSYQIRVTASYQGQQASTTINQSNAAGTTHAHVSGKVIAIIAGVAAAGAVTGAVVATRGGGTPTATIAAGGAGALGPPR
jgi:hypothetical protein